MLQWAGRSEGRISTVVRNHTILPNIQIGSGTQLRCEASYLAFTSTVRMGGAALKMPSEKTLSFIDMKGMIYY